MKRAMIEKQNDSACFWHGAPVVRLHHDGRRVVEIAIRFFQIFYMLGTGPLMFIVMTDDTYTTNLSKWPFGSALCHDVTKHPYPPDTL